MEGGEGDDEDEAVFFDDADPVKAREEGHVAGLERVEGGGQETSGRVVE